MPYRVENTKSGFPTLIFDNGKETKLHSAFDPKKEAERSVESFKKGRASIILVSGSGLAYHVYELKKRFTDTAIIVIEHDIEVFNISEKSVPENLEGVVKISSRNSLPAIVESIDLPAFRGIAHYIHRPSYLLYKEYYDSMAEEIKQYISSKVSDLLTRFEFESKWSENIFKNIPRFFRSGSVSGLFGKFRGYPGIIVSAGPSLRKNIDLINSLRDRAVVVCVDTAIKVMQRKKINPHIVMTLDAQKHSLKHFLGLMDADFTLLADVVSSPSIMRSFKGNVLMSTTSKYYEGPDGNTVRETTPVMDWIEKSIPAMGDIQSGGSVATSVFDLLLNMGCDPIILVGQDLAYTGREIHCSGTYHNNDWFPTINRFINLDTINQRVIRKRKIKYVEAFGGKGNVVSDFVFDLYRGWFEDSASRVGVRVINATEGGARIKNCEETTLKHLSNSLQKKKATPDEILKKNILIHDISESQKLVLSLEKAEESIRDIKKLADSPDLAQPEKLESIFKIIDQSSLNQLFNPYLRKASTYIARHGLEQEKSAEITIRDLSIGSEKLAKNIQSCLNELKKTAL